MLYFAICFKSMYVSSAVFSHELQLGGPVRPVPKTAAAAAMAAPATHDAPPASSAAGIPATSVDPEPARMEPNGSCFSLLWKYITYGNILLCLISLFSLLQNFNQGYGFGPFGQPASVGYPYGGGSGGGSGNPQPDPPPPVKKNKKLQEMKSCATCQVVMSEPVYAQHMNSKRHLRKAGYVNTLTQ